MKKLGLTLTAAACTLTLAGCSFMGLNRTVPLSRPSSDEASASPSATASTSPTKTVFSSPDSKNPFSDDESTSLETNAPSKPNQQSSNPTANTESASASASPATEPEKTQAEAGSTAPEAPVSLTVMSKEAATEFVNYWVQLHNYAMQTGDVKALEDYTDSGRMGQNFMTKMLAIQIATENQGTIEGCTYELSALAEIPSQTEGVYGFTGDLLEHGCVVSGRLNYSYPETSNRMGFAVSYNGSHWEMVYLVGAKELEQAFASANSASAQS